MKTKYIIKFILLVLFLFSSSNATAMTTVECFSLANVAGEVVTYRKHYTQGAKNNKWGEKEILEVLEYQNKDLNKDELVKSVAKATYDDQSLKTYSQGFKKTYQTCKD